jgi:uncharacterized DUF497 family protein
MYNLPIEIHYDPPKNEWNIRERGLPFDMARRFEFDTAMISVDGREDYGETRYIGVGFIDLILYVLVFTETETGIRVLSLRKAEKPEVQDYDDYWKLGKAADR